jgi:pSer/pThr/pTyr-binding forkhead associated (FHA) protein
MPREAAVLIRASGSGGVERLPLDAPEVVIGRALDNTYAIDDQLISRRHARILSGPDVGHRYIVEDLGSRNGTWVNGVRLAETRVLEHGDEVRFGGATFTFHDPSSTLSGDGPADLIVDNRAGVAWARGQKLPLSVKEYALLELLYRNLDRPVSLAEISRVVWPEYDGAATTGNVESLVRRLREKLSAAHAVSITIASQRGQGYVLRVV